MTRKRKNHGQGRMTPPVMEPDAAGNDVGATEIYVAVPSDRDAEPVRCFETFTPISWHWPTGGRPAGSAPAP